MGHVPLWLVSNWMYPGADGSATLWQSQSALLEALGGEGWRYTCSFGDLTASGPSSPNYFQFDDVGRWCAAQGLKVCMTTTMAVNNHAGWQTLADDATGWTNYLASGFFASGHACPPYGTNDQLVNKVAELQANGINRMRQFYTDAGLDPDEYVFITLPNERIWAAATAGSGITYEVCTFVEKMYLKLRELLPTTQIGSCPTGCYYEQRNVDTEITTMLQATGQGLNRLPGLSAEFGNATWLAGVDFWCVHFYMDTGAYFTKGADFFVQQLKRKVEAALEVFRDPALAGPDKPIWITEFGVAASMCGANAYGRDSGKYQYLRQGQFLKAMAATLAAYSPEHLMLYSACGDDTSASRMYGMMVGADANLDGGVDGQWRLTALPLLKMRGYASNAPAPEAPSANWITNVSGGTASGTIAGDLTGGGS